MTVRRRYRTTNWAQYNAALKALGALSAWVDRTMDWFAKPRAKRGNRQRYSDAAVQFCLSIKVVFGQPLRQTPGIVQSLLHLVGLNWSMPDFSTVSRRQAALEVQLSYRPSAGGQHRGQVSGRRGMEAQEARRRLSAAVA